MKKAPFLFLASLCAGFFALMIYILPTFADSGSNYTDVYSCRDVDGGIMIKRDANSPEGFLSSSTRDAGHGLRSYKMSCTSRTRYRTEWEDVETDDLNLQVQITSNPPTNNPGVDFARVNAKVGDLIVFTRHITESGVENFSWQWEYDSSKLKCEAIPFDGPDLDCKVLKAGLATVQFKIKGVMVDGTGRDIGSNIISVFSEEEKSPVCTSTDGLDYNIFGTSHGPKEGTKVVGTYADSCGNSVGDSGKSSGAYIAETHCSGPSSDPYVHTQWYKCPGTCENGKCIELKTNQCITTRDCVLNGGGYCYNGSCQPAQCYDSDNGEDLFTKGYVKGHWGCPEEGNSTVIERDYCIDSYTIREAHCNGGCDNILLYETKCPSGHICQDGACIKDNPNSCTDTDGLDYNIFGTSHGPKEGTKVVGTYADSCGNSVGDSGKSSGAYIAETHCSGPSSDPYVHTQWYKCPETCENGKCIDSTAEQSLKILDTHIGETSLAFDVETVRLNSGDYYYMNCYWQENGRQYSKSATRKTSTSSNYTQLMVGPLTSGKTYTCFAAISDAGNYLYRKTEERSLTTGQNNNYCSDSDGGLNYYKRGQTGYILGTAKNQDFCKDKDYLVEHTCGNNGSNVDDLGAIQSVYKCPNGCLNGRCLLERPDNSDGYPRIDDVSGEKSVYKPKEKISLTIKASESSGVPGARSDGWNIQYYTYSTADTKNYLKEYIATGNYNASFDGAYWQADYWAPNQEGEYYTEITFYCSQPDKKCGAITEDEYKQVINFKVTKTGSINSCTDSDGGRIFGVRGKTIGKDPYSNNTRTETDKCSSDTRIIEFECKDNGEITWNGYDCPVGEVCQDGTCLNTDNKGMSCGNSGGDDGLYSACKEDAITHNISAVTVKVSYYNDKYVQLALKNAKLTTLRLYLKQPKTITSRYGKEITLEYTEMTDTHGAFIQITSDGGEGERLITLPYYEESTSDTQIIPTTPTLTDEELEQKKEEILGSIDDIDVRIAELKRLRESFRVHLEKVQDLMEKIKGYNFVGEAAAEIAREVQSFEEKVTNEDLSSDEIEHQKELLKRRFEVAKEKAKEEKFRTGIIPFEDTDDDQWFTPFVKYAKDKGVISGYKDENGNLTGKFGPGDAVTRAQILKMALEMAGYSLTTESNLRVNHWAKYYIQKAKDLGIDFGTNDLDAPTTRLEAVRLIVQIFGLDTSAYQTSSFPDVTGDDIPYIEAAKKAGIIDGYSDGTFGPLNRINRAEASKILSNAEGVK